MPDDRREEVCASGGRGNRALQQNAAGTKKAGTIVPAIIYLLSISFTPVNYAAVISVLTVASLRYNGVTPSFLRFVICARISVTIKPASFVF